MTEQLVHRETERRVTVRYKVEAIVECSIVVADAKVREALELDPTYEITTDTLEEFVTETTDESLWDLKEIAYWDRVEDVEIEDENTRMVAPPEFVALPGMESL